MSAATPTSNPLRRLRELGQSFWWDSLSRRALDQGQLARRRDEDDMRGITSNPTIFHEAIARSDDYDAAIARLWAAGRSPEDMFWDLAVRDIQDACDALGRVYTESDGADGFVSLEVSPHLAFQTARTQAQAEDLWKRVGRPNLMIKIPGTPEGVPAIRACLAKGININITLLFAQQAHEDVMRAYQDALEERVRQGLPVDRVASVASFFVSRVDTLIDKQLDALGSAGAKRLRGQAAIANAKQAYRNYQRVFAGPRWQALVEKGARVQRPLWASTSTKDPSYSDVMYVETLIGPGTVNTMPTATIDAYRDHGRPRADTVTADLAAADALFPELSKLGIELPQVTEQLLREGVAKFASSFDELLAALRSKAQRLGAAAH